MSVLILGNSWHINSRDVLKPGVWGIDLEMITYVGEKKKEGLI